MRDVMRSAMWAIGRYDTTRAPSTSMSPNASRMHSIVHVMFAWSSITPFGGPVVPEV